MTSRPRFLLEIVERELFEIAGKRALGPRDLVLEQGLQNGNGRVRLGNRDWPVRGPNLPAGAKARVTGVDGTVLLVDRVAA